MVKFLFLISLLFSSSAFAKHIVLDETNSMLLNDYVQSESVGRIAAKAQELDTKYPSSGPIYLVLYTGGGSIVDGLDLINHLKNIKRPVQTIVIHAYSMGFVITQALGERYMLEYSDLMQHRAKGGFFGEFPGAVVNRLNFWLRKLELMQQETAKRSKKSVKELNELFNDEYWCTAGDCVKDGFADEVVTVTCDATLTGEYTKTEKFLLGMSRSGGLVQVQIEEVYSKCPLVPAALKSEVSISGSGHLSAEDVVTLDNGKVNKIRQWVQDRKNAKPNTWIQGSLID